MNINTKYIALVKEHSGNPTQFFAELEKMASRLGIKPEWIADVMYIESGFRPFIKNPQPNQTASGLIQMTDANCRTFAGVPHTTFLKYTNMQQLPGIEKYFKAMIKATGTPKDWFDTYCLVFQPVWVKAADSATLSPAAYKVNSYIDLNKNGSITKAEFRTWATKQLPGGVEVTLQKKPDSSLYWEYLV